MELVPEEIRFQGVKRGEKYVQLLRVRNVSGKSSTVRISGNQNFGARLQNQRKVAPNLYADLEISYFAAKELPLPYLEEKLRVKLEGSEKEVRLRVEFSGHST